MPPRASTHSSPVNREAGVLEVPHAEAEDATLALAELLRMLREHGEPGQDWGADLPRPSDEPARPAAWQEKGR